MRRFQRDLFALEDSTARSVLGAYQGTRRELVVRILDWFESGGGVSSPAEARRLATDMSLVREIDGAMGDLEADLGGLMRTSATKAQENALELASRELTLYMREFGISPRRLAIDRASVAIIESVVQQVPGMLATTRAALTADLRRGLISGESFPQLVRSVLELDLEDRASAFRRGQTSMELFARRSVIEANNASRNGVYQDAEELIPGLQKQAIAVINDRTTETCLRVHGQIREIDEPYHLTGTPRFSDEELYPPFHFRCRSSSVAYHADFEEAGGLTTDAMREAAQEALAA
jgi:hypothetical protein